MSPRPALLASIPILLLLLCRTAGAQAPPLTPGVDGELRLTLESHPGAFSPYASVRYTLWISPEAATLSATTTLPGPHGQERRVDFIPPDALAQALPTLAACAPGSGAPPPARRRRPHQRWTLLLLRDGVARDLTLDDPHLQPDPRWQRCVEALRALADAAVGPIPFRDTFFPDGGWALLNLASTPAARIFLDGVDLGQTSPVSGVRVSVGEHVIRFVDPDAGLDRTYTVRAIPEATTRLDVDLR